MTYEVFLGHIIDNGITAARADYIRNQEKLRGAVAGFEACRDKKPSELAELLEASRKNTETARRSGALYWQTRCFEAEVEWVCNCISVVLHAMQVPIILHPTLRATTEVAQLIQNMNRHETVEGLAEPVGAPPSPEGEVGAEDGKKQSEHGEHQYDPAGRLGEHRAHDDEANTE